ncbi:hypothetical protein THMIRHAS_16880 [Thiosulfatimonas sediminis]|uniref:Uncharacterized protein n=1 Tax=Thiosulfatimonas sediminis TaxID=2675054 RepID=A0A6F8PW18_9GAMM|nr:hypothetical protein THMIRHAS_16880 [Thiosulfatimonas sediminis]
MVFKKKKAIQNKDLETNKPQKNLSTQLSRASSINLIYARFRSQGSKKVYQGRELNLAWGRKALNAIKDRHKPNNMQCHGCAYLGAAQTRKTENKYLKQNTLQDILPDK